MEQTWIRTCQECGHEQEDKFPGKIMSFSYAHRKCRECKSEALDYGSDYYEEENITPELPELETEN